MGSGSGGFLGFLATIWITLLMATVTPLMAQGSASGLPPVSGGIPPIMLPPPPESIRPTAPGKFPGLFREEPVALEDGGIRSRGILVKNPDLTSRSGILILGNEAPDDGYSDVALHSLSMYGLVTLAVDLRKGLKDEAALKILARAVELLKTQRGLLNVAILGVGRGAPLALAGAASLGGRISACSLYGGRFPVDPGLLKRIECPLQVTISRTLEGFSPDDVEMLRKAFGATGRSVEVRVPEEEMFTTWVLTDLTGFLRKHLPDVGPELTPVPGVPGGPAGPLTPLPETVLPGPGVSLPPEAYRPQPAPTGSATAPASQGAPALPPGLPPDTSPLGQHRQGPRKP